ncbi:hypothetical protein RB601_006479 [Gaeumannomyces tritici]
MTSQGSVSPSTAVALTASRFFDVDLFSDPIVKPNFSARSSVGGLRLPADAYSNHAPTNIAQAPSGAKAVPAALARDGRVNVMAISHLISPPTSPTSPGSFEEQGNVVYNLYPPQGPPRKAVVEELNQGRHDEEPPAKRQKLDPLQPPVSALRRYSARAQGRRTATKADRIWNFLPQEIQLKIWDIALEDELVGRVVVVQNRNSPYFNHHAEGSVNITPDLSSVSQQARGEFERHYKKMFARIPLKSSQTDFIRERLSLLRPSIEKALQPIKALEVGDKFWRDRYNVPKRTAPLQHKPTLENIMEHGRATIRLMLDTAEEQWVNVDKDIIQFEPCCDGCRATHCVKRQFTLLDREAVRFICVKGEPHWVASAQVRPCWSSLSEVFPNAETLYLDVEKTGPTALIRAKRVMVRVRPEGILHHHVACLAAFELWKRGEGKDKKLSRIELVSVYEERPRRRGKPDGMQYPRAVVGTDNIFIIR